MAGMRWRLRARVGVRAASALAAAASVAVILLVAGVALGVLVDRSLRATVEDIATQRAEQLANRMNGNYQDDLKQNAIDAIDAVAAPSDLVEVVVDYDTDSSGGLVVLGASERLDVATPMSDLLPGPGETQVVPSTRIELAVGSTQQVLLVAAGGSSLGRHIVALAAAPLDPVNAAIGTVVSAMGVGVPILVILAGFATYLFAGRALRPVEAMRSQVAEMTDRDLGRRVPVPPARDEVGRLAETMNSMLGRLEDAQAAQRRFVADASHELRSPLATISTGLELMAGPGNADPDVVSTLRGEAERLNRLVDGLLLLARADERGLQPRRDDVDLDDVLLAERGRPGDAGGVVPEIRVEPVRVVGDRGQLARVVRNLVDNALRHARSRVLVSLTGCDGQAVVEVIDDGPGIAPPERSRVFERFVRLDDARARADGGAGLGLAIVAEVVAAHGGNVEIDDAPEGGALFRVRLPAIERDRPPAAESAELGGAPEPRPACWPSPARGTAESSGLLSRAQPRPGPAPRETPSRGILPGSTR